MTDPSWLYLLIVQILALTVLAEPSATHQTPFGSGTLFVCGKYDGEVAVRRYTLEDMHRSIRRGYLAALDGADIVDDRGVSFPIPATKALPAGSRAMDGSKACKKANLMLMPLVREDVFSEGDSAGRDRVVFDRWSESLCGVVTGDEDEYEPCRLVEPRTAMIHQDLARRKRPRKVIEGL